MKITICKESAVESVQSILASDLSVHEKAKRLDCLRKQVAKKNLENRKKHFLTEVPESDESLLDIMDDPDIRQYHNEKYIE